MRHEKVKLTAVLLLSLGLTSVQAQEGIPASGGNASGSGGIANYSVGQPFYTVSNGANGYITEGLQQAFDISIVTQTPEGAGVQLQCSVYPNPVTDVLVLTVDNSEITNLSYMLFGTNGNVIECKTIEGSTASIIMKDLAPATYFIKVLSNSREIKSFKIIKN